ncbi:porin [Ralstonia pickettii]|jgi:outer membrane protein OmpU|uniref:Porin n=1 Tax=Ralstonia pickettii TaxID=329 RepID=A0A7X2HLT1_RALPI|nr:porin [Ralstonia pickettii]MRS98895.1 porin [Ralstonia pickettii]
MRTLIAIASSIALQALSLPALSQTSSLNVFGSVDAGVTYVSNVGGALTIKMQDGVNKSNSLGFAGSEDLGGGKSAIFKLENGFSADTGALGQGGLMFGKQAWVGVADRDVGQLMLGRQYDFTVTMLQYLPCLECGLYSVQNADFDRISGERLNQSVQFRSADYNGLTYGLMYAFGANSGTLSTNLGRAMSGAVQYTNSGFSAGAAYTDINGAPVLLGLSGVSNALGIAVKPTTALFVDNQRIFSVGTAYRFGAYRVAMVYSNSALEYQGQRSTDQVVHVGGEYSLKPNLILTAQLSADRIERSRWYTANIGVNYLFSKRTTVYLDLAAQRATGVGTSASIALAGVSSTAGQFLSRAGIRHLF